MSFFKTIKLFKMLQIPKIIAKDNNIFNPIAPSLPGIKGYSQVMPGLFCKNNIEEIQQTKSKRHKVAKLKRARRKDGKKIIIQ